LYFRGCHMLGTKDQKTYLVYAYSYLARNKKGFLSKLLLQRHVWVGL
jgi:hypothetical protein